MSKGKTPKGVVVKVGGVIADGKGGFYSKGDTLPDASNDTFASLKAKGFAE